MNNLVIRREQLDGAFVTKETMQTLVDKLSAVTGYHFTALKNYVEQNALRKEERKALFGSNLNLNLTHCVTGYFGPNTVFSCAQLLDPIQRTKALKYYCNYENYEIKDWNLNPLDGMSPMKGPCLVFLVKFMEEIIGFKNCPDGLFQVGSDGKKLSKPMRKTGHLVGFNNNFQPEDYMNAPNKLEYMRNLTIVQKILALQWMIRGNYAFREDLLPITDNKEKLKKAKKEKPPKKPRKLKTKPKALMLRDGDVPIKGVTNAITQDDFRSQPLFQQIQYLYEMVGGSLAGRSNQKLSPDGRVSRADFMAATLNQQTMWLYRQLQGYDEDGDEDNGLRKHLGKYYKIGGNALAIKSLKKLSQGRLSHQTRYLGKRAIKHEAKIQRLEKQRKVLEARIKRAEGQIELIKRKTFSKADQMKDKMGEFDKQINKGGGLISKMNLINMIAGYAIDAVVMTLATTALVYAVQAKYRLDDHDKRFRKVYAFLTDDLYYRFQFIWNEFSHLNDDVTLAHLEVRRAEQRIQDLVNHTDEDRAQLHDARTRVGVLEENQDSLMAFRNRMEVLMALVAQFFERNDVSFSDLEGGLVDADRVG